jgi:hypothetical protein
VSPQRYAPLPFITYTLHACSTHVCSVQSHVIAKNHSSINYAMRVGLSSGDRVAKVPAAPVTRADTLAPSLIAADRRLNRPRMQFNHELAFCTQFSTPFFPATTVAWSGVKGLKIVECSTSSGPVCFEHRSPLTLTTRSIEKVNYTCCNCWYDCINFVEGFTHRK